MKHETPLIILGMHRSGTSMLTRMITSLNVHLGKKVNVHHESLFFLNLNDVMLSKAHCYWDTPININNLINDNNAIKQLIDFTHAQLASFKYRYTHQGLFNNAKHWGWKDPRNILFIPVYNKIFPNARYIFISRNGVDVANSLNKRESKRTKRNLNHITSIRCRSIENSFELWEEYMSIYLNSKNHIDPTKLLEIRYEDLVKHPQDEFIRISKFLRINSKYNFEKLNTSRAYNFLTNDNLVEFYKTIEQSKFMKQWGYQGLLEDE